MAEFVGCRSRGVDSNYAVGELLTSEVVSQKLRPGWEAWHA